VNTYLALRESKVSPLSQAQAQPQVGLFLARLQAVGQAKPGPNRLGEAGPQVMAQQWLWLGLGSQKPKPSHQAPAFKCPRISQNKAVPFVYVPVYLHLLVWPRAANRKNTIQAIQLYCTGAVTVLSALDLIFKWPYLVQAIYHTQPYHYG